MIDNSFRPRSVRRPTLAVLILSFATILVASPLAVRADEESAERGRPGLRRPVAIALSADERWALVANSRSGSVSLLDWTTDAVIAEIELGGSPSDLAARPGTDQFLVTDQRRHQLIVLKLSGDSLDVLRRLDVSPYPVGVVVSPDGRHCFVSSLWSRRLTKVALDEPSDSATSDSARTIEVLDLPIAPRSMILLDDRDRLIAADSFGGKLAVVDTSKLGLIGVREFPAHNIRGLAIANGGDTLVIAHQMLNELAHTVRNDVHWGLLMSNDLRWLRLNGVLDGAEDLYVGAHMHPLGEAGSATSDPAGLAIAADGTVVTTLGGVGELAIGREKDFSLERVRVGRRPTAVVVGRASDRAYVVNTFGDSVSVVDLIKRDVTAEIKLSRGDASLSLVDRGEQLFYDGGLSHDGWMSCHSCHTDGHTNGLLNDNFSDGSFGAPKRVLSLRGRVGTEPLAWNAGARDLEQQIRKSIQNTMQSDRAPRDEDVAALAAYVRTLEPPPSVDALRGDSDPAAVARGGKVFERQQCARCHRPPHYTTPDTYAVELEDELGNREFNPPSLRGLSQRGPYFHDNRAKTLRAVLTDHGHPLRGDLTEAELRDLIAFLRSL